MMNGMDELKLAAASVDVNRLRECVATVSNQNEQLLKIIGLTFATLQDSNLNQEERINLALRFLAGGALV